MTMWFDRKPGQAAAIGKDEPALFIGEPDWLRLPAELGGQQLRVECTMRAKCPVCGSTDQKHTDLEGGYGVCECVACGKFHWYRRN